MSSEAPIARGPLNDLHRAIRARMIIANDWEVAAEFDGYSAELARARTSIGIADLSHLPKLQIIGPRLESLCAQFPPAETNLGKRLHPGQAWWADPSHHSPLTTHHSLLCAWLADDQLVAISLDVAATEFTPLQVLAPTGGPLTTHHSLVDVTADFAAFDLVGPRLEELLCQLLSIDISARSFPPGHCAQTGVARIPAILIRAISATFPRVQLWCAREYGAYLWEALLEKARRLGGGALGSEAWHDTFS